MSKLAARLFIAVFPLLALAPATASADPPVAVADGKWEKIGERTVNGKMDKDTFTVGRDDGIYTAIRVKVEGSTLKMFDVKVFFANGEVFDVKTPLYFDKDSATRTIDLPGNKRIIKRVEMKYGNVPGGGNARVELWGNDVSGAPPQGPAAWKKLGQQPVNGKADKDSIVVGADDGSFTAIQVKVEGSALKMYDIKVVFLNGEVFDVKTPLVFDKDSATRTIDLPGNKRIIKRVDFHYGNMPGGGNARVELWGKR